MSHSNTPPVRNRAPLTARSSSLRCVSAAEHQTAEQYSKTGRTKPRKHIPKSDLSWNTRQDFKIPSLCEAARETERRCFSKVIFESNCGTCHMASTFVPHPRTAAATVCSTSSLLLLGFTLSRSFHFFCCKQLLGRNNTATTSAPHERCRHLLRGALLLSCSVTNL